MLKLKEKYSHKLTFQLILFASNLLLLGTAAAAALEAEHEQEVSIKQFALQKEPSSINLKLILQHANALEAECAKYHDEKVKQLESLIKFNDDNKFIHLPEPLQVKVPAVCLFLFGKFGRVEPMLEENQLNLPKGNNTRLDIVNWIYNEDEIRKRFTNVTVKREVEHQNEVNHFLDDYLYKQDSAAAKNPSNNEFHSISNNEIEQANEERIKFHENIEKILNDEQFKNILKTNRERLSKNLSPVILVPGLLGSRLQARTDKTRRVNIFCSKQSDWQDMWLSVRKLLPLAVDCWLDNVRLEYNLETGFTRAPSGVEARVPDFGSVESVRYLDLNQPKMSRYMAPLIERYEQMGYTADKNLLAAPYDFRLAPQELGCYFDDLKMLIDKTQLEAATRGAAFGLGKSSSSNSNGKVTLVCHSMGCTHLLLFLRKQKPAWRQSRIRKLIALSSPWGGSIKALKALVVGDQLDLPLVSEIKMRNLARTYPSIAYLLPQAEIFAQTNMNHAGIEGPALVQTPSKSYKVNQLEELLRDLNLTRQWQWFKETSKLIKPLEPLADLQVDCIHSLNTPTPETLVFNRDSDFPDGEYETIKGEGDGTVNFESLMVCANWANQLPDKVVHKIIMNTNHLGVLSHKITLDHLTDDAYMS